MAPVPTVHVLGAAETEVIPDELTVTLLISSDPRPTAAEALAEAVGKRRRVSDAMQGRFPAVAFNDRRIVVHEEQRLVERRTAPDVTESHYERLGFVARCAVVARAPAELAGALVAHAGAQPDAGEVEPVFGLSSGRLRELRRALEQEAVRDGLERAAGLAAAAGLEAGAVISIGESVRDDHGISLSDGHPHARTAAAFGGEAIAEALGELRPEPELHRAQVAVRVALVSL